MGDTAYMAQFQKNIYDKLDAESKMRVTKSIGGNVDYMMSSINAGPQKNDLAGKPVASFSVFSPPTCSYERSIMIFRRAIACPSVSWRMMLTFGSRQFGRNCLLCGC